MSHLLDLLGIKHFVINQPNTHDGIPRLASLLLSNLINWLDKTFPERCQVEISVLGHSLGGLIAWCMCSLLLNPLAIPESDPLRIARDETLFRINLRPTAFYAVSSPVLGSRRSADSNPLHVFANAIVPAVLGETGRQLFVLDRDEPSESVIGRLLDPKGPFINALAMFETRTLIGHTGDLTVCVQSACCMPEFMHQEHGKKQFQVVYQSGFDTSHQLYTPTKTPPISQDKEMTEWRSASILEYAHHHYMSIIKSPVLFRRVILSFGSVHSLQSVFIHAIVVGKRIPGCELGSLGMESGLYLVRLIRADFEIE